IILTKANLLRAGAIDIHPQIRTVHNLVHMDIGRAGNLRDALFDLVRDLVALRVAASDLNIDRRRNAEVQNLANDVRRGEEKLHVRKIAVQFLAQNANVLGGRPVLWSKCDENFAVSLTDGGVVAEGEINS